MYDTDRIGFSNKINDPAFQNYIKKTKSVVNDFFRYISYHLNNRLYDLWTEQHGDGKPAGIFHWAGNWCHVSH